MVAIPSASKDEQVVALQEVNEKAVELENTTMSLRESVTIRGMLEF